MNNPSNTIIVVRICLNNILEGASDWTVSYNIGPNASNYIAHLFTSNCKRNR